MNSEIQQKIKESEDCHNQLNEIKDNQKYLLNELNNKKEETEIYKERTKKQMNDISELQKEIENKK